MTSGEHEGFPQNYNELTEQVRETLRQRIRSNLNHLATNHFPADVVELAGILGEEMFEPYEDPELGRIDDVTSPEGISAWNDYYSRHPEALEYSANGVALQDAKLALEDQQAVETFLALGMDMEQAIEAVLDSQLDRVQSQLRLMEVIRKAVEKHNRGPDAPEV